MATVSTHGDRTSIGGEREGGTLHLVSDTASSIYFNGQDGADILDIEADAPDENGLNILIEDKGGANDFTVVATAAAGDVNTSLDRTDWGEFDTYDHGKPTSITFRATADQGSAYNSAQGFEGADRIIARATADWAGESVTASNSLSGFAGNDRISAYATIGGVDSYATNYLDGGAGNDRLYAKITIKDGATVADAHSELYGGDGDDRLSVKGGEGNILNGGKGDDVLLGSAGADTLIGMQGDDYLRGRGGDDVFLFGYIREGEQDRIVDFTIGEDKIDLSQIDARAGRGGNQAFSFDASGEGGVGKVWIEDASRGSSSVLHADNGSRELVVILQDGRDIGPGDYHASDFLL